MGIYRQMQIIPLTAPYVRADVPADHPSNGVRNCVFVGLTDADGRVGWGEAYSGCYATEVTVACLRRMERSLMACESDDPAEVMETVRFRNLYWAMRGVGAVASSAIEAAVFDLYAQAQGKPLWQLLNGGRGRKVMPYASAGDNSFSPEGILRQTRRLREQGFRAYKIRAGGKPTDDPAQRLAVDVDRVAAAREGIGADALVFVDVGVPQRTDPWPRARAEAYLRALEPFKVGFLEEPAKTYDIAGYAALQKVCGVPVAGGESFADPAEFTPFFEAGAFGVAQPDAAVVGGPVSCIRVCREAAGFGVPVCLHAWSAGVGIAQNLHAAWAAAENALAVEFPVSTHPPQTEPLAPLIDFRDGYLLPSARPGLGVDVGDGLLERYRYQPGKERDF